MAFLRPMFGLTMQKNGTRAAHHGGLALALVALILGGCEKKETPTPSAAKGPIILISVDTLRADHLPAWGSSGVRTPDIDALAADSIVFENAYSHVPMTLPSHVSILTGQLPQVHGVRNNIGYTWNQSENPPFTRMLGAAGYETGAAISAYVLRGSTGFSDAFDSYDDAIANQAGVATGLLQRPGAQTIEIAKKWIGERRERPFFFMLHLFEPHSPWEPAEPFAAEYVSNPYDGEIAATDALVGEFVRFLKEKNIYDRATIVFLSDHGEGLGDHGEEEHGIFLYREAIHVPLMIKLPDNANAGRVREPVQLIDVAPTILALSGVASNQSLPGIPLVGGDLPPDRQIYSETLFPRVHLGWSELRSLIDSRYHYIEAPHPELYDHVSDPRERVDVLDDTRRVYAAMRGLMDQIGRDVAAPSEVDPEEAAKLAALGYIGTVRDAAEGELLDPKDHIADFEELKRGGTLAATGRQAEAVELFRRVLARNPRVADAWNLLGTTYEQMGLWEEALGAYKKGIENAPVLADQMALSAASVLLRLGRADEATAHAKLALDTDAASAHQILARVAMERGEFAEAEREAGMAMDDPTKRTASLVIIAQSRVRQGKADEALQILLDARRETLEKGMRVELLEYSIGDVYATMQRWDDAEIALLREIETFPSNLQAYSSLVVVYVVSGRHGKVDPLLEKMVETNPTRLACLTAARTLKELGDDRSAEAWTMRAAGFR